MIFQKLMTLPIIALSLALSTGCSAKSSQKNDVTVQNNVQQSAKVQHNVVQHDHAQSTKKRSSQAYMKPGASISYEHNLPADIEPGQTVVFQLTLDEGYNGGNMSVDIKGEGDIQIFPSSARANFDMSSGASHVMDVSVTVGSSGRHYLNVQALANTGQGQTMPRIFSIPVQSGPTKAMEPHEKMSKTTSGENIIVMEAEEVIQ